MQNKLQETLKDRQKEATDKLRTSSLIKLMTQKVWLKVQKDRLNKNTNKRATTLHKKQDKQKIMFPTKHMMPRRWLLKPKIKAKICTTEPSDMLLKLSTKFQIPPKVQKEKQNKLLLMLSLTLKRFMIKIKDK